MKLLIALIALAAASPLLITEQAANDLKETAPFEVYDANENPFRDWTINEMKAFLFGTELNTELDKEFFADRQHSIKKELEAMNASVPTDFDSRKQWPNCIHPIRDQQQCGSCWAFSVSEVMSDRFCIASNGAIDVVLSPQYQLQCDWWDHGCNGGILSFCWSFQEGGGDATDACVPYSSGSGSVPWTCPSSCSDGSKFQRYPAKKSSAKHFSDVESAKVAIMTDGPIQAGFTVYEDFMHYKGGIYKYTSGSALGGHAVKIVGWGNEDGTDYWIVANSWNTTWGEQGFFRIAFGQCDMDSQLYAGEANVDAVTGFHTF